MNHLKQKRTDEIMIMRSGGTTIACGYKCSRCGQAVFPLGASLPDELLTPAQRSMLNTTCKEKTYQVLR